ncbi:MAG: ATP-binding protein [Bacteroidota bacterium]
MQSVTIQELKKVVGLSDLPDEHLEWILDRSDYKEFQDDEVLYKKGDPIEVMWFLIEGKCNFYLDVNGKLVHYFTFDNDVATGGVGGLLPYSRMKVVPGSTIAVGKIRILTLHKKHFPELEQLNPDFIQRLIGYLTERARSFATVQLQHEKVNALGQLAAGIAHELNNPASAINRISSDLTKRLNLNYELTEELFTKKISPVHVQYIRNFIVEKESHEKIILTSIQKIKEEDEITEWLDKNNFAGNKLSLETFIETGFSKNDFEVILRNIGNEAYIQVLHWLENLIGSKHLLKDLEDASSRISNLVGAIKSHVHMDRSNEMQPTNIHKDIDNTITLLNHKMRDKNISITKKYCEDLVDIPIYVGELNQVWTNIIDNAIFAVEKNGEIKIETACGNKEVTVKIIDNGGGIPKEIISRIFDPFFTTKKVGQGTGIGLDLVNRIIKRHNGEIKVNSVPGMTEFIVRIPFSKS